MDSGKIPEEQAERRGLCHGVWVKRTPYPVIVTVGETSDYIRVLLYSYYRVIGPPEVESRV